MTQIEKIKKLKVFLNVYGVLSVMIFGLLFVAFIFKFKVLTRVNNSIG